MLWLQHFLFGGTLHGMAKESRQNAEQRAEIDMPDRHRELQSFHKVLYDAVGELSPGLSEEAFSTLCSDARSLELNQITLNFQDAAVEAEFQQHVAVRRRPILLLVFCFDVVCYLFRMAVKFARTDISLTALLKGIFPQLCNMMLLYTFLGLLNRRSRRLGYSAARQEEFMLTGIMILAICNLLATINESNPQDYVYAAMFMISTTCFLKIQWLVGTSFMMLPLLVTYFWHKDSDILPSEAMVHLIVSWAVGGFMAYLSDTYRRQMFVNHRLAKIAAEKELQEAQARINVQQQLATAQAQAAQRAITVAREKAANEAKSEFMSLMCHEVRTPLNGCLASAEMLLEMPLQEEQRELAKTIRVSGSILLSTVSNFLDFFKMEAGKQLDVVRTEMMTKDLVGDIHCIIEATIGRSSEVHLEKPNTDGVPDYVLGDPDRLRGILLNLYTNAAKFTKRGSIALRVRVASKDYRPSPAQVIAQQQRGPYASWPDIQAGPGQIGRGHSGKHSSASWGAITAVSPQKGTRQAPGAQHSRSVRALSHPQTAASDADISSPDQARAEGPGAKAATDAYMTLQRGQDAHNAAEAIDSTNGITTPVACEHVAGHALLQHAGQVINKAADKMQKNAGLNALGVNKTQPKLGHRILQSDLLHTVKEERGDDTQSMQGKSDDTQSMRGKSERVTSQTRGAHQLQGSVLSSASPQHEALSKISQSESGRIESSSGRLSNSSVLDLPEESSSSGGSPSESKADFEDQADEPGTSQHQPAQIQCASTYSPADSTHASVVRADPPEGGNWDAQEEQTDTRERRTSGTSRSFLGECTHSNSDVTDSDASFRCSGSSCFSDYPPPMRKSFSSPPETLNEAADEAAAAQQQSSSRQTSGLRRSGGFTATSYNGMSSGKATLAKGVVTTVQELGDGWCNTVAHPKAPVLVDTTSIQTSYASDASVSLAPDSSDAVIESPFQHAPSPADVAEPAAESEQWLVFEVTDTGCGISQRGLASLFTEYVQGTEDDMKQPRTRGGTGLGLSICSKQVSVLGGLLGAMSKLGEGSTFWFTIPLLMPAQSAVRESISMRRTASWGSRDAFTDGHLSRHQDPPAIPQGRRTLAATTKAHRQKRSHPVARSANYQAMQQQRQQPGLDRTTSMIDPDQTDNMMQRAFPSQEAARRMSAPEAPPGRTGGSGEKARPGMRVVASDDSTLHSEDLGQPTAEARAAVARAVLCPPDPSNSFGSCQQSSTRSSKQGSHCSSHGDACRQQRGSLERLSQAGSTGRSHGQLDGKGHDAIQRNLLAPYKAGRAFQAPPAEMIHQRGSGTSAGPRQDSHAPDSPSRPLNIRPSMEARRRRLGLSALQGRLVLLAEDNLINQRVAKMMLSSLGMTVEVVSNGQEAVDAVKRRTGRDGVRQFDVLLMDMAMPVMGGVDATKEIRRAGGAVPIVAMTANSSDKDRDECLESGVDGFLSKPVLKDRLAEAILSAVSGRRQFQDRGTISLKAYDQL